MLKTTWIKKEQEVGGYQIVLFIQVKGVICVSRQHTQIETNEYGLW